MSDNTVAKLWKSRCATAQKRKPLGKGTTVTFYEPMASTFDNKKQILIEDENATGSAETQSGRGFVILEDDNRDLYCSSWIKKVVKYVPPTSNKRKKK